MRNMKANTLADGAVCTALTVLFFIITIYVPPFALVSVVVTGTPMVFLGVKHGLGISAVAFAAGILTAMILTGSISAALMMGVVYALPGVVIGYCIHKRTGFYSMLTASAGTVLFGLMVQLLLINAASGGNGIQEMLEQSKEMMKQMVSSVTAQLPSLGNIQNVNISDLVNEAVEQAMDMFQLYFPAIVVIISAILGYAVLMFGIFVLRRTGVCRVPYQSFSLWKAPRSMCTVTVILFLVTMFSKDDTVYTAALYNVVLLLYAAIGVCGFSLLDYKLAEKLPSGYLRALIYTAALVVGYVMISLVANALILLGLMDGMLNFRRLGRAGDDQYEER